LTVHVNREGLHSLWVPDSYVASNSFEVVIVNHGGSTHVHLHLDDALSTRATIEAPNHHVAGGKSRRVQVTWTRGGATRGNLKVVTSYGATTRLVDVALTEPVATDGPVEVDEQLSNPQPRTEDKSPADVGPVPIRPVLAASGTAVGLAVGGAAVFGSAVAVIAALAIVVLAVAVVVVVLATQSYTGRQND
jgi:hypothetical protein